MRISAAFLWLVLAVPVVVRGEAALPREPLTAVGSVSSSSLVRVNSTNQAFDFFRPWTKKAPFCGADWALSFKEGRFWSRRSSSQTEPMSSSKRRAQREKSPAEIVVVDYDCNLALLRPTDLTFLKEAKPVSLDSGASVGDKASILQLESNGLIADTPGVITTITVAGYPLDHLALLTYRISAPLQNREGSFTIPAIRDGRLLGLLMRYDSRTQTADVIAAPVISHFLDDAKLASLSWLSSRGAGLRRDPRSAVSPLHRSQGGRGLHHRNSTWERCRKVRPPQGRCHPRSSEASPSIRMGITKNPELERFLSATSPTPLPMWAIL